VTADCQQARLSAKWIISAIENRKNHLSFTRFREACNIPIGLAARVFGPAESVLAHFGLTAAGFLAPRADKM
jgi:hypothetical protein